MKKFLLASMFILTPAISGAATLISKGSGNWSAAGTWYACDTTTVLDSELGTTVIGTAISSSSAFVPGPITINALAIKVQNRIASPVGLFSIDLYDNVKGAAVSGTTTTINVSDFVNAQDQGWYVFPTVGNVVLLSSGSYFIRVRCSVANEVSLWRNGTANNHSRQLRTATTQAPAGNDLLIIAGEKTGLGTGNVFTVTMDDVSGTSYGATNSTSIAICNNATLQFTTATVVNSSITVKGFIGVYGGGIFNIGTTDFPIPQSSTAAIMFNVAANVDSGLFVAQASTFNTCGATMTYTWTHLSSSCSFQNKNVTVADSTGWVAGSSVVFATTNRAAIAVLQAECESKLLNANATPTSLAFTVGLSTAHTGPNGNLLGGEIGLITHNVFIRGRSAVLQGFINISTTAVVNSNFTEYSFLGSAIAGRRGIDVQTTIGVSSFVGCSFHDFTVASSLPINLNSATSNNVFISSDVFWNNIAAVLTLVATSGTNITFQKNLVLNSAVAAMLVVADSGLNVIGNTFAGGVIALSFTELNTRITGTVDGNTMHSLTGAGLNFANSACVGGTVSNSIIYKVNLAGAILFGRTVSGVTIDSATLVGNLTDSTSFFGNSNILLRNITSGSMTGFPTLSAVNYTENNDHIVFENGIFGVGTATHTQTFLFSTVNKGGFYFNNCLISDTTEYNAQSGAPDGAFVAFQKDDNQNGNNKVVYNVGVVSLDTTTLSDVAPSVRMTPNSSTGTFRGPPFVVSVASNTFTTVTVKVRASVAGDGTAFNGSSTTIVMNKNVAAGVPAEVVCATATAASAGSYETLTCVSPTVTDDAVLSFQAEVDGTKGWVNIDTWTNTNPVDSKALKNWTDGLADAHGDNNAAGTGSGAFSVFVGQ